MAKRQRYYTKEFRKTIVELYNSGKSLAELSSEYGISKSTINRWLKRVKPITVNKYTTITSAEYQAMLNKMARLEEEKEEVNLVTYCDFNTARIAIFEYIESWYNRKKLHSSIGYMTP